MRTVRNIALWLGSLLLSVSLFSLIYGQGAFLFVFRITIMFATPVAFLYLPFLFALRDAEEGRIWTILATGILIGPISLVVWGLFLDLRGVAAIWQGDGIGPGLGACLIFGLTLGVLTTTFYVIALKVIYWRFTSGYRT